MIYIYIYNIYIYIRVHVKYHNVLWVDTLPCVFLVKVRVGFWVLQVQSTRDFSCKPWNFPGIFGGVLFRRFFHMETSTCGNSPGGFAVFCRWFVASATEESSLRCTWCCNTSFGQGLTGWWSDDKSGGQIKVTNWPIDWNMYLYKHWDNHISNIDFIYKLGVVPVTRISWNVFSRVKISSRTFEVDLCTSNVFFQHSTVFGRMSWILS